jgi:hypothetical protein
VDTDAITLDDRAYDLWGISKDQAAKLLIGIITLDLDRQQFELGKRILKVHPDKLLPLQAHRIRLGAKLLSLDQEAR